MKKLLLILLVIMCLLPIASAFTSPSDFFAGYNLSNTTGWNATYSPLTNVGGVNIQQTGFSGQNSSLFSGVGGYYSLNSNMGITNGAYSYAMWIKPSSLPSSGNKFTVLYKGDTTTSVQYYFDLQNTGGTQSLRINRQSQNVANFYCLYNTSLPNAWHHVVVTYDGTYERLFLNGSQVIQCLVGANGIGGATNNFRLGSNNGDGDTATYYQGNMLGVYMFSRNLSQTEISSLFSFSAPNYGASAPVVANFSLTARDFYTNQSLQNISATFFFANGSFVNFLTTNGSLDTTIPVNLTSLVNVSITSTDNALNSLISPYGYYGNFTNVNVSANLQVSMIQSRVDFGVFEKITGAPLSGANFTSAFLTNTTHYMRANNNTLFNATKSGYYNLPFNFSTVPFQYLPWSANVNYNATGMYNLKANITLRNMFANTSVTSFNVTVSNDGFSYSETINTTNGTATINLVSSLLYNVTIVSPNMFPVTLLNVNLSTNLVAYSYAAILNVHVYDALSNVSLFVFNVTNPPQFNSTTNRSLTILSTIGVNNLTVRVAGYDVKSLAYAINTSGAYFLNVSVSRNLSVFVINESDGSPFFLNSVSSMVLSVHCNDIVVTYLITAQNQSIETCAWNYLRLDAFYPTSSLFRTIIPSYASDNITFVMPDANTVTVYQIIIQLNDLTGQFLDGEGFLYKMIGEVLYEIIGQRFDAQSTINTYLIKDNNYLFGLRALTGETRIVGYFNADQAGLKVITVPTIEFAPSTIVAGGLVTWAWSDGNNSIIRFLFNDSTGDGATVNFVIANASNLSQILLNVTTNNVSEITYTYFGDAYNSYLACFAASTSVGVFNQCRSFAALIPTNISSGQYVTASEKVQTATMLSAVGILIVVIALSIFSPAAGILVGAVMAEILCLAGFFVVRESTGLTQGIIAVLALLGGLAFFYEVNKKKP